MTETQGKRVDDVPDSTEPHPRLKAGEYRRVLAPLDPYWECAVPTENNEDGFSSDIGSLRLHEIEEHEDGTITVSPSILLKMPVDGGAREIEVWHGYLERGVWRSV